MIRNSKKIKKKVGLPNQFTKDDSTNENYEYKKYDFDELALFHSPLSKYVHFSPTGTSIIDWKNPLAVKELTKAILLVKFKLNFWDIPSNFLCPTIPSRITYLEWINSLLIAFNKLKKPEILGVDIGTGASLIYPILGIKIYGWKFFGTEINPEAFSNAEGIIEKNKLKDKITLKLSNGGIFKGVLEEIVKERGYFDFTMCNPPFFENLEEQKKVEWRVSELNKSEGEYPGGEAGFIKQMIKESTCFKTNFGFFSSLIGRKKDYEELLDFCKENEKMGFKLFHTKFTIGKNIRWAIAWKFFE